MRHKSYVCDIETCVNKWLPCRQFYCASFGRALSVKMMYVSSMVSSFFIHNNRGFAFLQLRSVRSDRCIWVYFAHSEKHEVLIFYNMSLFVSTIVHSIWFTWCEVFISSYGRRVAFSYTGDVSIFFYGRSILRRICQIWQIWVGEKRNP